MKANPYYLFVEICGKIKNDDSVIALPLGQKVRNLAEGKMKKTSWIKRCKRLITKHLFVIVLCIGVIAIGLACLMRFGLLNKAGKASIKTSSLLTDAIDISELSTAEFRYRGIADIYSDEERTRVHCRVCYNAIVKAGIDMEKVQFDVDAEKKVVTAILPDIDLKVTIIDEQSMALLPSGVDVGIDSMLKYSKEDAETEARESTELINTAQENLKATIEGLLFPILKAQGYSLVWA